MVVTLSRPVGRSVGKDLKSASSESAWRGRAREPDEGPGASLIEDAVGRREERKSCIEKSCAKGASRVEGWRLRPRVKGDGLLLAGVLTRAC